MIAVWARAATTALGIWLMAAPAVLGYGAPAATNDRIFGPIAAAVAIIAAWDVTRALRWIDLLIGIWPVAAPAVLSYEAIAAVNSALVGAAMALLSFVRGQVRQSFGGGWRALLR